jgi:flagellar motor switch protein FliN
MFTQDEIDAVLSEAQIAVTELAGNVNSLAAQGGPAHASAGGGQEAAVPPDSGPPALPQLSPDRMQRILKLKVPVVVRLAERSMLLSEIMKIMPGTILEFPRTVSEELDLLANNHQIGHGVAVKVNERFGLRVSYIGDVKRRITSLTVS